MVTDHAQPKASAPPPRGRRLRGRPLPMADYPPPGNRAPNAVEQNVEAPAALWLEPLRALAVVSKVICNARKLAKIPTEVADHTTAADRLPPLGSGQMVEISTGPSDMSICGRSKQRLRVGIDGVVEISVDPVVSQRFELGDNSLDHSAGKRDLVRIAAHEAD